MENCMFSHTHSHTHACPLSWFPVQASISSSSLFVPSVGAVIHHRKLTCLYSKSGHVPKLSSVT